MRPVVTAIIPVHQHERWVGQALDSVLAQDYPKDKLRVVVVDDGSTDGSFDAVYRRLSRPAVHTDPSGLEQYAGAVDGVPLMLVRHPKALGPSAARNAGIAVGWDGTDLFAMLDSDDYYMPGKIAKSVEVWLRAPEVYGVVYSDYFTLSTTTGVRLRQYKEPYHRQRLFSECLPNADSLVSKRAFEQVGVFDAGRRVAEDLDLWLRVADRFVMAHIPEALVTVRVGPHSSSSTVPKAVWEACHRAAMEGAVARQGGA